MSAPPSSDVAVPEKPSAACAIGDSGGCKVAMNDDILLLRRFVIERSDSAFTELVQRKTALVYSAALRQVNGDMLLAQDVAQSVFIDLARKAQELVDHPALTSWLYTSTRFAALKALREKARRQHREQEAQTMEDIERDAIHEADWHEVRPLIDEAMCALSEPDRTAILMRYFESQPFAAMGEKLGIGESSARMRAERALDKLRGLLGKKGVASTAAALGLTLSAKAVIVPPVDLAGILSIGALTQAAGVGAGAGAAVKVSKVSALAKAPTGVVATATVGAAGLVALQAEEKAAATAFIIYVICFGVGLLFTLISAIAGHVFGGHGELAHDVHVDHAQGHAEAGPGTSDMPGFSPLSPTTIAAFVTAFGGFGMIFNQFEATRSSWISAPLAAVSGLAVAAGVFVFFNTIFRKTQSSSEGRVAEVSGLNATVITPIAAGGVGEIAYVQSGTRYSAPARSESGATFGNGATVRITRVVGAQFYVTAA